MAASLQDTAAATAEARTASEFALDNEKVKSEADSEPDNHLESADSASTGRPAAPERRSEE